MRILFHAPGLAVFRPAARLPHLLGVQASAVDRLGALMPNQKLTGNRGNLIHAEAPARTFAKDASRSAYGNISVLHKILGAQFADLIAVNFDLIIISMANFIRPDFSDKPLVTALQALGERVPFIVLGCGLQGAHRLSDMKQDNRNLISHFNEHALVFGVRGEKTGNWLADNGFGNAKILGCPSLYAYPNSILKMDGAGAQEKTQAADVMTAGHLSIRDGRIVPRGLSLAKAFQKVRASYVFQDEFFAYDELLTRPGLYSEGSSEVLAGPLNAWLSKHTGLSIDFERYYYFNEAGAWRQAALRHDLFIGDRFHGGVAALQAGRPAIFLTHDNRVAELTEYFDLPSLTTEEFERRGLADTTAECLAPERLRSMKTLYKKRYVEYFDTFSPFGLIAETQLDRETDAPELLQGPEVLKVTHTRPSLEGRGARTITPTIVEQGTYRLRMLEPKGATELVVTFEAADTTINRNDIRRKGFGENFLLESGFAVLSVLTSSANWFRPPALADALKRDDVANFRGRFAKLHSYGSSMGAFGALAFADLLGVSNVVALQPISTLAHDLVPWETRFGPGRSLDWSGSYRDAAQGISKVEAVYAFFDPASEDARHIARIDSTAGSRLRKILVKGAAHAVPRHLQQAGVLGEAIIACLNGRSTDEIYRIISV